MTLISCIFCGREFSSNEEVKEHIAKDHIGVHFTDGEKPNDIEASKPQQPAAAPEKTKVIDTPKVPMEKPRKRYLNAEEILSLIQNTNKQFQPKELAECPITKGE